MQWLTADIVFDGYDFHSDYFISIDDNGVIQEISKQSPQGALHKVEGLLMPGMINAHCHLELSHYKGVITKKTGLSTFLQDVDKLNQKKSNEDDILLAIQSADSEMQKNGIVAVGDICNTVKTKNVKLASPIHYHNFIECIAIKESEVQKRFAEYQEVYDIMSKELSTSYALHSSYTCHEELYKLVNKNSNFISIHNQESEAENLLFEREAGSFDSFYEHFGLDKKEIIREGTNKNSLINTLRLIDQRKRLLLVHNTYAREGEVDCTFDNVWFCLCPKANLYIEDQLPPVLTFLTKEHKIVLGTDSLASNDCLNILSEAMTIQNHYPEVPLNMILQWATSNGAKLFGLEKELGSFEKGKSPGFVKVQNFDVTNQKLLSGECEVLTVKFLN